MLEGTVSVLALPVSVATALCLWEEVGSREEDVRRTAVFREARPLRGYHLLRMPHGYRWDVNRKKPTSVKQEVCRRSVSGGEP